MTIKHIFTDLDGTLLDARGNLPEQNVWAIYYSQLPVSLVSARSPLEMLPLIEQLNVSGPQIAYNGNLTFQKNEYGIEVLDQHTIACETVTNIIDLISTEFPQVSLSWYSLSHWYAAKQDKGIFIQKSLTHLTPTFKPFNGQSEIYKIMMMVFDPAQMEEIKGRLAELNLPGISIKQSGAWYLEVTSDHYSKSDAISTILKTSDIQNDEVAAIGDGENDIPMLQMVGLPIVVENANQQVKKYAKMVVGKNTDSGVAQAISAIHDLNQASAS
ncbi:HAD family hydrolase [Lactococcus sp.]|uniref:HAD family hydrolase n=1 Tax=Lactococcus sp. TaxID=44273 RepID=UPI0035AFA36A